MSTVTEKAGRERDNFDDLLDRLRLDIEAVMALSKSSPEYNSRLLNRVIKSTDLGVRSFNSLVASVTRTSVKGLFMVAAGEFILSGFLIFIGFSVMIPAFFVYSQPRFIISYFYSTILTANLTSFDLTVASVIVFLLAILLLISAFVVIRMASEALKNAGFTVG
ncbi:MAG: hypothetical protein QXV22_02695 [Thermoplasmataceae archaeon]